MIRETPDIGADALLGTLANNEARIAAMMVTSLNWVDDRASRESFNGYRLLKSLERFAGEGTSGLPIHNTFQVALRQKLEPARIVTPSPDNPERFELPSDSHAEVVAAWCGHISALSLELPDNLSLVRVFGQPNKAAGPDTLPVFRNGVYAALLGRSHSLKELRRQHPDQAENTMVARISDLEKDGMVESESVTESLAARLVEDKPAQGDSCIYRLPRRVKQLSIAQGREDIAQRATGIVSDFQTKPDQFVQDGLLMAEQIRRDRASMTELMRKFQQGSVRIKSWEKRRPKAS